MSASILMGLAIGLDAAIATGINAPTINRSSKTLLWIGGITLTHTVFPMVGYLMSYYGLQEFPLVAPIIGVVAFSLIAHFLYDEITSLRNYSEENRGNHQYLISLGLILAVSWDALWSGPAKSAQVIEWPPLAIWASFLVVGATVATLSTVSFIFSSRLTAGLQKNKESQADQRDALQWLQLSCVGYFGWLALARYTFDLDVSAAVVLTFSFTATGALILRERQRRSAPTGLSQLG